MYIEIKGIKAKLNIILPTFNSQSIQPKNGLRYINTEAVLLPTMQHMRHIDYPECSSTQLVYQTYNNPSITGSHTVQIPESFVICYLPEHISIC